MSDRIYMDCGPSVSGEILQSPTQCVIHPTLEGEGWESTEAVLKHIDYPLENARWALEAQYVKLLRNFAFLWWFISLTSLYVQPSAHLHLCFLSYSHPYSLSRAVIPGLVVRPFGRLRGAVGERAVGRLCGHRARLFPQPTSNTAEPWPQWVLTLKIRVERNSASQTLFRAGLSIGGEKSPPYPNCGQCPAFVYWSSGVGRPAATSQDKTSEKPIQHVIWPPGSIADSQGSNAGNLWGFSSMEGFHPLKLTLLKKLKMTNDFF